VKLGLRRHVALGGALVCLAALPGTAVVGPHSAKAAILLHGAFNVTTLVDAFPCPLNCGIAPQGWFNGVLTGVDVSNRPFDVTFTSSGATNAAGTGGEGQACTGDPTGELDGGGHAGLTLTGGALDDDGVLTTGASAFIDFAWWQEGTGLVIGAFVEWVKDGSGTVVAMPTLLDGGDGAGQLTPTFPGGQIPESCFDQYEALLTITAALQAGP